MLLLASVPTVTGALPGWLQISERVFLDLAAVATLIAVWVAIRALGESDKTARTLDDSLAVARGEQEKRQRERSDETAAIDDHIRALATQASLQIQQERQGQDVTTLLRRLTMRGSLPGDLMATWLTTMASEAPQASPDLRREATEVVRVFFAMAILTKNHEERGTLDSTDPDLNVRLKQLDDLLKGLRVKT